MGSANSRLQSGHMFVSDIFMLLFGKYILCGALDKIVCEKIACKLRYDLRHRCVLLTNDVL
jgi:hypothetical protein